MVVRQDKGLEQRRDGTCKQAKRQEQEQEQEQSKSKSKSKSIERRMSSELVEADLEGDVGPVTILAPTLGVEVGLHHSAVVAGVKQRRDDAQKEKRTA